MKLALKVVLSTVIGTLLVMVAFGYFRARGEITLIDADMRKDHRLLGSTLAVCVARIWTTAGPQRALELIDDADSDHPDLRIGWLNTDGSTHAHAPVLTRGGRATFRDIDHTILPDPERLGDEFLVTRVPVRHQGQLLGAIEVAESLAIRDGFLRSALSSTLLATFSMIVISGLVVLVLGVWLVGRPLRLLTLKAERVGQGDLGGPLELHQRDEIGVLALQVNAMCDKLAEAHARTQTETEARLRALEQLRHADRLITVGRLAAGVAHELGTPLNIIAGRAKMLRRGDAPQASSGEILATISEQAERMTTIIRQLMDFARRREPKTIRIDLLGVARASAHLVEPLARRRGLTVQVTSTAPTVASGDPMQLEQVVSNLLVNAMQACDGDGLVEVSCGVEVAPNDVPGTYAFIRVTDNGHGMDAKTVERIFEPFFTTKDVGQGTGLGLSVAHGIVQEHGGFIDVRSSLGSGSSFTVFVPREQA